jgi:GH15 family glucan-1,4-alpha-glucosidase
MTAQVGAQALDGSAERPYPDIEDYGFIADCHSAALISRSGSIDWCCMPRLDSSSVFGRLLGWENGGFCRLAPTPPFTVSRRYREDSLVLETTFATASGRVLLTDCFTMRRGGRHHPRKQIIRLAEGLAGRVDMALVLCPRFDYGAVKPWIRRLGSRLFAAVGGADGLRIAADFPLAMDGRHDLTARFSLEAGQRACLSLTYIRPENLDEPPDSPDSPEEIAEHEARLEETLDWWRTWTAKGGTTGAHADFIRRSAIVLKALACAPTGAIAAAATTSLPEAPGVGRNWDYRFSWVRDSVFTVLTLAELGYVKEADGFRRFMERSTAGSAQELQILYGLGGERRLEELPIRELEGYRGNGPVRRGNAAHEQVQHDIYGELLSLAWHWQRRGCSPDDDYWEFLVQTVDCAARSWQLPDHGLWEMRGEPRHFVHSKAGCWSALDRGLRLAAALSRPCPHERWATARDEIRQSIETRGYDPARGVFVQAFDRPELDAALLRLPSLGFVTYDDPRMIRTAEAIAEELAEDGLVRRYAQGNDNLPGREGTFLACTFWLAECLARQGRVPEAKAAFERGRGVANDLGLLAEEFDAARGRMCGNFPQGLSHLSAIAAAVALDEAEKAQTAARAAEAP